MSAAESIQSPLERTVPIPRALPRFRRMQRFSLSFERDGEPIWSDENSRGICEIGRSPGNDLVLEDPCVSAFHCELRSTDAGVVVRHLGNTNDTLLNNVQIREALIGLDVDDAVLRLGNTRLYYQVEAEDLAVPLSERTRFGTLVGTSDVMRELFSTLEKCAHSDASVVLIGETGAGKEGAALGIHSHSGRSGGPFQAVNCGAIPKDLVESELFGHERGAFTGATEKREGLFREANGGTLFLDEIGELPLPTQTKLLRVLQSQEVRPIGHTGKPIQVDVRIIAATNRDLRQMVNEKSFRADLYYRLNVIDVRLPPLRERVSGDLSLLVESLMDQIPVPQSRRAYYLSDPFLSWVKRKQWPGNVRELRNVIEGHLATGKISPHAGSLGWTPESSRCWPEVREKETMTSFRKRTDAERMLAYLDHLFLEHGPRKTDMAKASGGTRENLYRVSDRIKDYYEGEGQELPDSPFLRSLEG